MGQTQKIESRQQDPKGSKRSCEGSQLKGQPYSLKRVSLRQTDLNCRITSVVEAMWQVLPTHFVGPSMVLFLCCLSPDGGFGQWSCQRHWSQHYRPARTIPQDGLPSSALQYSGILPCTSEISIQASWIAWAALCCSVLTSGRSWLKLHYSVKVAADPTPWVIVPH